MTLVGSSSMVSSWPQGRISIFASCWVRSSSLAQASRRALSPRQDNVYPQALPGLGAAQQDLLGGVVPPKASTMIFIASPPLPRRGRFLPGAGPSPGNRLPGGKPPLGQRPIPLALVPYFLRQGGQHAQSLPPWAGSPSPGSRPRSGPAPPAWWSPAAPASPAPRAAGPGSARPAAPRRLYVYLFSTPVICPAKNSSGRPRKE